jgi:primosomal protein N' (replication factor Y) (superfamily II helicase)
VRVRTDVAAVAKMLDYVVPTTWRDPVVVGTRVRVPLHGRSVKAWVVEVDVTPPAGVEPLPLKSWLGWGPPPAVVELAGWAAWRWAGPVPFFLRVASPLPVVRGLPVAPPPGGGAGSSGSSLAAGLLARVPAGAPPAVLRLPPTADPIDLVLAVANQTAVGERPGSLLVLVPSVGWAERMVRRLARRGYAATMDWAQARAGWPIVVGSRAAAWAPLPNLTAAIVLDAHDEAYREESAPTYSAVDVVVERARREGCPCLLASPVPPVVLSSGRSELGPTVAQERAGWAAFECVDRRGADPRSGMFSEEFVRLARSVLDDPDAVAQRGPLVCVYNRKGRARLLACRACGELARCTNCGAAVAQHGEGLRCPRCGATRPLVCAACGKLSMKTLRAGVTRLREEVAALLGTEVAEVTAAPGGPEDSAGEGAGPPVLVGTQAVLHRTRRAAAVAFLDIDLHLLAPRFDATDETLALLVRASRLVGPRGGGSPTARVLAQTRVPDHPVLLAAARGEPAGVLAQEASIRQSSGLPPFSALALVSGSLASDYAAALGQAAGRAAGPAVSVSELPDGVHLVRAPDHDALCNLLAQVPRPPGRGLRVAVDPSTV